MPSRSQAIALASTWDDNCHLQQDSLNLFKQDPETLHLPLAKLAIAKENLMQDRQE
jgi:hypothetical protein